MGANQARSASSVSTKSTSRGATHSLSVAFHSSAEMRTDTYWSSPRRMCAAE